MIDYFVQFMQLGCTQFASVLVHSISVA